MSHLLENGSDVYTFSYNDVECRKFGFGGGRHNVFDYSAIENRTIVWWGYCTSLDKKMCPRFVPGVCSSSLHRRAAKQRRGA